MSFENFAYKLSSTRSTMESWILKNPGAMLLIRLHADDLAAAGFDESAPLVERYQLALQRELL